MTTSLPISQSIIDDNEACYLVPRQKQYHQGSIMDILMSRSPLFAYIAQVAELDDFLDHPDHLEISKGITCFAPCKEYSIRYLKTFKDSGLDRLTARSIILSSVLQFPMNLRHLQTMEIIPTMWKNYDLTISNKNSKYFLDPNQSIYIHKSDLICSNGILHFTNGIFTNQIFI